MNFITIKTTYNIFILLILANDYGESSCQDYDEQFFKDDNDVYLCSNDTHSWNYSDCRGGEISCFKWCTNDLKWTILNRSTGNILIEFPMSPSYCCHERFNIELLLIKEGSCASNSTIMNLLHSSNEVKINSTGCAQDSEAKLLSEVVKAEFIYVFSGCYRLSIMPKNSRGTRQKCFSNDIEITTDYGKQLLADVTPTFQSRCFSNSEIIIWLSYEDVFNEETLPDTTIVRLNSVVDMGPYDCNEIDRKKVSCCEVGKNNDCCYPEHEKNYCNCEWQTNNLSCRFTNITSGNYCIQVQLIDIRCTYGTLWVDDSPNCLWTHYFACNSSANQGSMNISDHNSYSLYIILIGIVVIGAAIFKWHKIRRPPPLTVPEPPKPFPLPVEEERFRILLLYPRDCPLFMSTMTLFRKLLEDNFNTQVYDIWDEDMFENVAEKQHFWALNFMSDPNVKVILVASKCSRLLEDTFVSGKDFTYVKPNCLDSIFVMVIRCLFSVTNSGYSYKKINIIRLDGMDFQENSFKYVNPFSVYTIPRQLEGLILDLKYSGFSGGISAMLKPDSFSAFTSALSKYNAFKKENPNYLDEILRIS